MLSYSIYLVHPIALWGVVSWLPRLQTPLQAGLGLVITLTVALVIYEVVEKPAARLRRRLSRIDGRPDSARQRAPAAAARPEPAQP